MVCSSACAGQFEIEDGYHLDSCFLGPEKMVVTERPDGRCVCQGLVPIPVSGEIETGLFAAMKIDDRSSYFKSWSGALITDRDRGLFDAVTPLFGWNGRPNARKDIYEMLRLKGNFPSPYHGILAALEKHADLVVTGLLLEVADRPSRFSVALGATLLVAKKQFADSGKWTLTSKRYKILKEAERSEEAQLIKCYTDELLGIAFVTGLPVLIPTSVYDSVSVDGLLQRKDSGSMSMETPHFSSYEDKKMWYRVKEQQRKQQQMDLARAAKNVPKAHEIKSASAFLRMKTSEKRACLRATGVMQLPRPREGPRAVDALMIPLLDEEVAYEVLRRLAETKGDYAAAADMEDFESKKPLIARQYREGSLQLTIFDSSDQCSL